MVERFAILATWVAAGACLVLVSGNTPREIDYHGESEVPRKAIVISIGNYDFLTKIPTAKTDFERVKTTLEALKFQVTPLYDVESDPAWDGVKQFWGSLEPGDIVFVYYSGHGFQYSGINFLVPKNTPVVIDPDDLPRTAIPMATLIEEIKKKNPGYTVLIFDACRENNVNVQKKGLGTLAGFKGVQARGLAPIPDSLSSVAIMYATSPGRIANTFSDPNVNSLLTKHFVSKIVRSGYDAESSLRDTVNEVSIENNDQVPELTVRPILGAFHPNPSKRDLKNAKEAWNDALISHDAFSISKFVKLWPGSRHTPMARKWLEDNAVSAAKGARDTAQVVVERRDGVPTALVKTEKTNVVRSTIQEQAEGRTYRRDAVASADVAYYDRPSTRARVLGKIQAGEAFTIDKEIKLGGLASKGENSNKEGWSKIEIPAREPGSSRLVGFVQSGFETLRLPINKSTSEKWTIDAVSEAGLSSHELATQVRELAAKRDVKSSFVLVRMPNQVPWARSVATAEQAIFLMSLQIKAGLVSSGISNNRIVMEWPEKISCGRCQDKVSEPRNNTEVLVVQGV
jgi:hypothetical protein